MIFPEGESRIQISREILDISDPEAEISINEYMVACYGTTEYPEDMTPIQLSVGSGPDAVKIQYAYKCREEAVPGAKVSEAIIPPVQTKVTLTTDADDATSYVKEGYAFSPMFTLGMTKKIRKGEVVNTWLNLEKAN